MNDVKGNNLCKPLHCLKDSHRLILEQMQEISTLVCELKQSSFDEEWDTKWYHLYKHVVSIFAQLKLHLYKEEHFLFPLMKNYFEKDDNMLMVMDHEHKMVEQKFVQFIETFENRRRPFSRIEALSLLSCIEFARTTLLDHIHKEESVLFPFAEVHLQENEKQHLSNKIDVFG